MVTSVSVKLSVIPCPAPLPTMISLDDEINYLFSEVSIVVSVPVEHIAASAAGDGAVPAKGSTHGVKNIRNTVCT